MPSLCKCTFGPTWKWKIHQRWLLNLKEQATYICLRISINTCFRISKHLLKREYINTCQHQTYYSVIPILGVCPWAIGALEAWWCSNKNDWKLHRWPTHRATTATFSRLNLYHSDLRGLLYSCRNRRVQHRPETQHQSHGSIVQPGLHCGSSATACWGVWFVRGGRAACPAPVVVH